MILSPSNPFIYRLVRAFPVSRMAYASLSPRSMISRCHSSAAAAFSCLPAFSFSRWALRKNTPKWLFLVQAGVLHKK